MSDRAMRQSGRNWASHRPSVRNGLQSAALAVADPWLRDLAGSILHREVFKSQASHDRFRWRTWLPGVDSFLYDGRLPFASETLEEGWPTDPVQDDPLEIVEKPTPARTAAHKLRGRLGGAPLHTWATALAAGADFEAAAEVAQLPMEGFAEWRVHPTVSDVGASVRSVPSGWQIRLTREAEASMPSEPIALSLIHI